MELCGLILSELPVLFSASQSDQLDGFSGKQKENVPPFTLDMVRTKVLLHATTPSVHLCDLNDHKLLNISDLVGVEACHVKL